MTQQLVQFGKKSDLTFLKFSNERLENHTLEQSLLIYTVFKDCELIDVDFQNCDLEGCQFDGTRFVACSFLDTDIRSVTLKNCEFIDCSFERALLNDLRADNVAFQNCNYFRSSITECDFVLTRFVGCKIERASFLHCDFTECHFKDMRIAECTFLYHQLFNTTFEKVEINIDSLGYLYGLESHQLAGLTLIFLSDPQTLDTFDLAESIIDEFKRRKWPFAAALLSISTGKVQVLEGLDTIIEFFTRAAQVGSGVKRDEVRFLGRILDSFERAGHVPLLFVQRASASVAVALKDDDLSPANRASLELLATDLFMLVNRLSETFDDIIGNLERLGELSGQVAVTVTHKQRPKVLFSDLLKLSDYKFLGDVQLEGGLVREWEGSWHELILMTTTTLVGLITAVALFNGLLLQLHRTRLLLQAFREPVAQKHRRALVASVVKAPALPASDIMKMAKGMLREGTSNVIPNAAHLASSFSVATKDIESIAIENVRKSPTLIKDDSVG